MSDPDDYGMRRTLRFFGDQEDIIESIVDEGRVNQDDTINWDVSKRPILGNRILTPKEYEEEAKEGSANEASKIFTNLVDHVNAMNCSKCGKRINNLSWVMRREVTPSFMGWGARTWVEHEECPTEDKAVDANDPFFCGD